MSVERGSWKGPRRGPPAGNVARRGATPVKSSVSPDFGASPVRIAIASIGFDPGPRASLHLRTFCAGLLKVAPAHAAHRSWRGGTRPSRAWHSRGIGLRLVVAVRRATARLSRDAAHIRVWAPPTRPRLPPTGMDLRLHQPCTGLWLRLCGLAEHLDPPEPMVSADRSARGQHQYGRTDAPSLQLAGAAVWWDAGQGTDVVRSTAHSAWSLGLLLRRILRRAGVRLLRGTVAKHPTERDPILVGGAAAPTVAGRRNADAQPVWTISAVGTRRHVVHFSETDAPATVASWL